MAIVHRTGDPADAHRIRALLEAHGIPAEVGNEIVASARGALPLDLSSMVTVWIADESRLSEARRVIAEYAAAGAGEPWRCRACGEPQEGAFTACWRCGAERP